MNRITRIVIGIALALSSACNYLDVVPEDNATLDDAFKSQDKALSYLFSIYGHLPNNISTGCRDSPAEATTWLWP